MFTKMVYQKYNEYVRFLSIKENLKFLPGIRTSVFGLLLFYISCKHIVIFLIFTLSAPFPIY